MFWEKEAKDSDMDAAVMLKILESCPSMDSGAMEEVKQMFFMYHRQYINSGRKDFSKMNIEDDKDFNEIFCDYLRKNRAVGENFVHHAKIELARTPKIGEILEVILEKEGKLKSTQDKKEFHEYVSRCKGAQGLLRNKGVPYEPIGIMLMKSDKWGITSTHIAKAVARQDLVGKLERYLPNSKKNCHKSTVRRAVVSEKSGWRKYIPQNTGLEQLASAKGLAYTATILIGAASVFNMASAEGSSKETVKVNNYAYDWGSQEARSDIVRELDVLITGLKAELSEGDKQGARNNYNNLGVLIFDTQIKDPSFSKEAPRLYNRVLDAQEYYKKVKGEIDAL